MGIYRGLYLFKKFERNGFFPLPDEPLDILEKRIENDVEKVFSCQPNLIEYLKGFIEGFVGNTEKIT